MLELGAPDVNGHPRPRSSWTPGRPDGCHHGADPMLHDPRVLTMDTYLDDLPPAEKAALERVRTVVSGLAPDAEEGHSYGMPAFIYAGRPLLGFRAAKEHLSIFPFSPAAVEAVEDRLDGFVVSRGTIRFSPDRPVPEDVLADVVRTRKQEITASG
jgi:uncharacterized protein YdhG (YjbR/CyaY superfamily)